MQKQQTMKKQTAVRQQVEQVQKDEHLQCLGEIDHSVIYSSEKVYTLPERAYEALEVRNIPDCYYLSRVHVYTELYNMQHVSKQRAESKGIFGYVIFQELAKQIFAKFVNISETGGIFRRVCGVFFMSCQILKKRKVNKEESAVDKNLKRS